jgi:hypothetical protein
MAGDSYGLFTLPNKNIEKINSASKKRFSQEIKPPILACV